jgi:hypothetical protein
MDAKLFYLDYEGGNDANDGTTFANRWKTLTSGVTATRIAPGDTIRIMASPEAWRDRVVDLAAEAKAATARMAQEPGEVPCYPAVASAYDP